MSEFTNRHPLLAASTRVALAAYLHDLGKFAERAAITEAEIKDAEGNTAKDIHKQEYCPKYNERYSHVHAAYTAIAMDLLEQYLPDIKSGDCSPFASWKDARHLAAGDSIVNAAARHHKPETLLQWIVACADRLASGFERSEFEAYNRAEEGIKERSHVTARMEVSLEKIRLEDSAGALTRDSKYRYRLEPLSPLALMPAQKDECEPEKDDQGRRQYRELWELFVTALKKSDGRDAIPPSHKKDLPLWFDHFDSLWMAFTHCIPSATAGRVDGKFIAIPADVSLYDHSKTTAALAAALWRWHESTGRTGGETMRALKDGLEDGEQKFLLVQGDMAGIQEFIFASGGSTQKYAAKLLRGRSFMISLLAECAALYVLESIGLPSTSQVINAAGKFLIVAPNTADTVARLEQARATINHWFLHRSQGRAGLALSWLPAAATDFRHGGADGSPFSRLMRKLFALLDIQKLRRLDICSPDTPAVFENYADDFAGKDECPLDAYSPAEVEYKGKLINRMAKDQIRIGEYLSRADYSRVLVTRAAVNDNSLMTDFFGYYITFAQGEDTSGKFGPLVADGSLIRAWDYSLPQSESGTLWNGYARRFINAYVPVFNENDTKIPGKYRHVDKEVELDTKTGDIKALDYLAHEDRFPERRDNGEESWRGISALHTLKGDVDNLGAIFQKGLINPTFARMASLSRQMNAFFAIWLPWRCRQTFTNTYTVFAGGDDFFLIGPWKKQMELAQTMREDFARYTAGNPDIHFSAGLYLSKPGLPVRHTGEQAEASLDRSKQRDGKDAVTCFGQTVDWDTFMRLCETGRQFGDWRQEYRLSTGFVYGLLRLVEMAGEEYRKPESALWRSWLAYRVQRHVGDRLKPAEDESRDLFERRRKRVVEALLGKLAGGIDKDVLYAFDTTGLASILTGDERKRLVTLVKQPGELLSLQQFIYGLRDRIAGIASHTVVVAPAVAEKYHNSIGRVVQRERSGRGIINALEISRTSFNPHDQRPVLPGSGIKGAIRTAVLNALNNKKKQKLEIKKAKTFETQLLDGSFSEDPLRLIKISDAIWREQEGNPGLRVVFDNNLPKNPANLGKERKGSGLSVMREILPGMTGRAFTAHISLQNMANLLGYRKGKISSPRKALDIGDVVRDCNSFYSNLLLDELEILKRLNCLDKTWLGVIEDLMANELGTLLNDGSAMLLRVGRHSGAEGITIEGVRSIKINLGKGEWDYLDHATTLWLAGEREKSKDNLQPFGWLLLEVDPQPGDRTSDSIFEKLQKFNESLWKKERSVREYCQRKHLEARQLQSERAAREVAERERREAEEKVAAERAAALAAMNEEQRMMMVLRERMENGEDKGSGAGCLFAADIAKVADQAVTWSDSDKARMAELLPELARHLGVNVKKQDKWKKRLRALKDL